MRTKIILAFIATVFSTGVFAQQQQNVAVCSDKVMHSELVSIDKSFEQKGFDVVQFNMMKFPSGAYVPVQVTLEQGRMYQINFLASKDFQQYNFTILDKDRKKLVDKKVKQKDGNNTRLSESFAAPYSGSFLIVISQKVKGQKEACGGLSILKAGGK
jgi:hypothetical protein